jgi:hypothetical protein
MIENVIGSSFTMLSFEQLVQLKQRLVSSVNGEDPLFECATPQRQEDKQQWLAHLRGFASEFERIEYPYSYSTYLYTCFEHRPLLISLQNQVFLEHMSLDERIRLLSCINRTRTIVQDPCLFAWMASSLRLFLDDPSLPVLLDELVRRWNTVIMRDHSFNPIERILRERLDTSTMLPFARHEIDTALASAGPGWGRESVRSMLRVASPAVYRFITLRLPHESLD